MYLTSKWYLVPLIKCNSDTTNTIKNNEALITFLTDNIEYRFHFDKKTHLIIPNSCNE